MIDEFKHSRFLESCFRGRIINFGKYISLNKECFLGCTHCKGEKFDKKEPFTISNKMYEYICKGCHKATYKVIYSREQ